MIYYVMVECQCAMKCWGHQIYNDISQQNGCDLILGTLGHLVGNNFLFDFLKETFFWQRGFYIPK